MLRSKDHIGNLLIEYTYHQNKSWNKNDIIFHAWWSITPCSLFLKSMELVFVILKLTFTQYSSYNFTVAWSCRLQEPWRCGETGQTQWSCRITSHYQQIEQFWLMKTMNHFQWGTDALFGGNVFDLWQFLGSHDNLIALFRIEVTATVDLLNLTFKQPN